MELRPVVISGGTILTMSSPSRVEALVIRGGTILHGGSLEECRAAAGSDRKEHDLGGRTLLPGFVDAHAHPIMFGQTASWLYIGPDRCPSVSAILQAIATRARELPPGAPIRAYGYSHRRLAERRPPTAEELDRVAPGREVYLMDASGHGGVVNSVVLRRCGIDETTPDIPGGFIGRDEAGRPTGLLLDAACDLLTGPDGVKLGRHGPNLHLPEPADALLGYLLEAQERFLSVGITTVLDAQATRREVETYLTARDQGLLRMRVDAFVISAFLDEMLALGLIRRLGDEWFALSGVKLYADGSLGGGTAWFPGGYPGNPGHEGVRYHEPQELKDLLWRAHRGGLRTGTHAQSPWAIGITLDAIEEAQRRLPRPELHHRIEHCGLPTDDQISRMAQLGVIPVPQPQHGQLFGDAYGELIGKGLVGRFQPMGLFARAGLPVVLSSDAPVAPPAPLQAVCAAVDRRTVSGSVLDGAELCLDVETALRGYTIGGALAIGRDGELGSLEPGKRADLVVLSGDPTSASPDELTKLRVEEVWVGGAVAWPSAEVS
jgi:predicted amidohydrolase YtcJ